MADIEEIKTSADLDQRLKQALAQNSTIPSDWPQSLSVKPINNGQTLFNVADKTYALWVTKDNKFVGIPASEVQSLIDKETSLPLAQLYDRIKAAENARRDKYHDLNSNDDVENFLKGKGIPVSADKKVPINDLVKSHVMDDNLGGALGRLTNEEAKLYRIAIGNYQPNSGSSRTTIEPNFSIAPDAIKNSSMITLMPSQQAQLAQNLNNVTPTPQAAAPVRPGAQSFEINNVDQLKQFAADQVAKNFTAPPVDWRYSIAPLKNSVTVIVTGESEPRALWMKKNTVGQFEPTLMTQAQVNQVWTQESLVDFDQNLRNKLKQAQGLDDAGLAFYLDKTGLQNALDKSQGKLSILSLGAGNHFSVVEPAEAWMLADKKVNPQPTQVFTIKETQGPNQGKQVVISTDDPKFRTATKDHDGLQGYWVNHAMKPGDVVNTAFNEQGGDVVNIQGNHYVRGVPVTMDPYVENLVQQSNKITDAVSAVRNADPAARTTRPVLDQSGLESKIQIARAAPAPSLAVQAATPKPAVAAAPNPPMDQAAFNASVEAARLARDQRAKEAYAQGRAGRPTVVAQAPPNRPPLPAQPTDAAQSAGPGGTAITTPTAQYPNAQPIAPKSSVQSLTAIDPQQAAKIYDAFGWKPAGVGAESASTPTVKMPDGQTYLLWQHKNEKTGAPEYHLKTATQLTEEMNKVLTKRGADIGKIAPNIGAFTDAVMKGAGKASSAPPDYDVGKNGLKTLPADMQPAAQEILNAKHQPGKAQLAPVQRQVAELRQRDPDDIKFPMPDPLKDTFQMAVYDVGPKSAQPQLDAAPSYAQSQVARQAVKPA